MGRKQIAAECLQFLCKRPDIEIVGVLTDNHLEKSVTADVARSHGLRILEYKDVLDQLSRGSLYYDLGLSVLYWRKLKGAFLAVPALKNINFHPAPLPDFKGTAGYNLAILEGLSQWGVTSHYMDEDIDTGGIIEVAAFPIDFGTETVASLERKCATKMLELFKRVIAEVLAKQAILPTVPNTGGRYITRRQMEEMKEIRPGDDVARKVRAFWYPPYDGAWINISGQRYTLVSRDILMKLADPAASTLFTNPADGGV